jgi:transcriptional adapter 2-alpha
MDLSFNIDPTEFQERKRRRISNMSVAPPLQKVAPTSAPGVHDIATFLPGRLEFEHEIDNEAEDLIKNLEFGLCMELGGDSIPEDEDDHDYKTRMRWKVEQREKDHDQEMVFVSQNGLVNGAIHGNGNGLIVNGLNGAANGFVRKDKEVKKEKDTPAPDDNGDGVEEESEENMPPIPFETQASLEFKLTLIQMYMQRIAKRREAKALMFDRGLLEYKKVCQKIFYGWSHIIDVLHSYKPRRKNVRRKKRISSIDYGHLQDYRLQRTMKSSPLTSYVRVDLQHVSPIDCSPDEAMLRKRIGELQQYRKLGLTTAADIKKLEDDLYKRVCFAYLTPPCFTAHRSCRLSDSGKGEHDSGSLFVGATPTTPGRQRTAVSWA